MKPRHRVVVDEVVVVGEVLVIGAVLVVDDVLVDVLVEVFVVTGCVVGDCVVVVQLAWCSSSQL